jgi:hypothetical protein
MFKEIIAVYSDNHTKPMNTKYTVTDFKIAGIYIPLGFKGLKKKQDIFSQPVVTVTCK